MASALPTPKKKSSPATTLLLFLTFGLVVLILFNATLRDATGRYAGYVLEPIIGLNGSSILATVFLASVILVILTTGIRHFLVDWSNMARVQEAMRAFQKEFMEARKANNTYKIKKLTEAQPQVMSLQAEMSTEQMKPMAYTMLLVIPIFAWLSTFVLTLAPAAEACGPFISVPWNDQWDLGAHTREACPGGYSKIGSWITPFPHWIAIYSLFGIPFGQIAQRALKLWEYRHHDLSKID